MANTAYIFAAQAFAASLGHSALRSDLIWLWEAEKHRVSIDRFEVALAVINGKALDLHDPKDLDALIARLIAGKPAYMIDDSGQYLLGTDDLRGLQDLARDKASGHWRIWPCLGGFARFTDRRSDAWLANLTLEQVA